ncbi:hypothetical protein BDY24DRAFT_30688 [Mrakia frigida]|uniref:uncharacterized protein n=1 Tax=Mrakia frigida TaxID=29902 RepID=UPI003FCBF624
MAKLSNKGRTIQSESEEDEEDELEEDVEMEDEETGGRNQAYIRSVGSVVRQTDSQREMEERSTAGWSSSTSFSFPLDFFLTFDHPLLLPPHPIVLHFLTPSSVFNLSSLLSHLQVPPPRPPPPPPCPLLPPPLAVRHDLPPPLPPDRYHHPAPHRALDRLPLRNRNPKVERSRSSSNSARTSVIQAVRLAEVETEQVQGRVQ